MSDKNKFFIIIILFFTATLSVFSQTSNKKLYSGGMLVLQPGYTLTENDQQKIEDISFGIGGIIRFYFYDHFTAGIYGGTKKTNYNSANSEKSYINLGYGGPFIGVSHSRGKFRYTLSAFVGNGTISNLHIEDQANSRLTDAYLYKNSTLVFSPILSLDYAISNTISLTMHTVFLTAKLENNKLYNPALKLGILFNR